MVFDALDVVRFSIFLTFDVLDFSFWGEFSLS